MPFHCFNTYTLKDISSEWNNLFNICQQLVVGGNIIEKDTCAISMPPNKVNKEI